MSGVLPHVISGGIMSLQYSDDTLLFLEPSLNNARNVKWLLSCFDGLSGMKINFNKCDLLTVNVEEEIAKSLAQIFCCKKGDLPLKYLGVPLHFAKLTLIKLSKEFVDGKGGSLAMKLSWCLFVLALPASLHILCPLLNFLSVQSKLLPPRWLTFCGGIWGTFINITWPIGDLCPRGNNMVAWWEFLT
ncbi:hypothetical protein VPH35_061221 [Triticum aestivum]|uniref:Reverse transcriptase domain-containing protein n=1 Tax=Aegilops tauschii subsp. strangulata TaxID=200361 RepID=A0A453FR00_AEGTS